MNNAYIRSYSRISDDYFMPLCYPGLKVQNFIQLLESLHYILNFKGCPTDSFTKVLRTFDPNIRNRIIHNNNKIRSSIISKEPYQVNSSKTTYFQQGIAAVINPGPLGSADDSYLNDFCEPIYFS